MQYYVQENGGVVFNVAEAVLKSKNVVPNVNEVVPDVVGVVTEED